VGPNERMNSHAGKRGSQSVAHVETGKELPADLDGRVAHVPCAVLEGELVR